MTKKIAVVLCVIVFSVFSAACRGGLSSAVKKGELASEFEDTKLDKEYLWVRGIAASNPEHTTTTQRRAMSREAAIANAYQRAVEFIKGSGVTANVRVIDAISSDSTIETKVEGLVRGGEIYSSEYLKDDGCVVVMRILRSSLNSINIELPEA